MQPGPRSRRPIRLEAGGRSRPAELQAPPHAPDPFSFRQIADQSFVSQNTVKTQAQSVYRKLGVSSRAEAVACARAAGLLDPRLKIHPSRVMRHPRRA